MGGMWLTYLLLVMLVMACVLGSFWLVDFVFDEIKAALRRRHEQQALARWKRIQELEKELDGGG